jgi:hypothetical protein
VSIATLPVPVIVVKDIPVPADTDVTGLSHENALPENFKKLETVGALINVVVLAAL